MSVQNWLKPKVPNFADDLETSSPRGKVPDFNVQLQFVCGDIKVGNFTLKSGTFYSPRAGVLDRVDGGGQHLLQWFRRAKRFDRFKIR
jgi:hypothetical protein